MEPVQFQLGSDPELFLKDTKTKKFRSAIPIIREGKTDPRPLDDKGANKVQHDNVLIEFNTEPARCREEFIKTVGEVLKLLQKEVEPHGVELHLQASTDFPEEELADEEAQIFGCDPDYTVYPPEINIIPAEAALKPFRSAGGHLHIGKDENNKELCELLDDPMGKINVVKTLDIFVGIPSVFLEKDPTAAARRELYGKAGAHRPKEYGVEYRATSSWWLASPEHTDVVHRLSEAALSIALQGEEKLDELTEELGGEDKIQEIINESQSKKAQQVYKDKLKAYLSEETAQLIDKLAKQKPANMRKTWKI